jgi:hypothetical protein
LDRRLDAKVIENDEIWKYFGIRSSGLVEVLRRHLPGGTEENREKSQPLWSVSRLRVQISTAAQTRSVWK